jgi:hypothetical protein
MKCAPAIGQVMMKRINEPKEDEISISDTCNLPEEERLLLSLRGDLVRALWQLASVRGKDTGRRSSSSFMLNGESFHVNNAL